MLRPPQIIPYGDAALLVQFECDTYSQDVTESVQGLSRVLQKNSDWTEIVAAYDSVLVEFDPVKIDPIRAEEKLLKLTNGFKSAKVPPGRLVEIPVYYGGEDGPDMGVIMQASGLSESEVISLHSAREYLVCMMGFIPGFAFLSAAHDKLHHPRRETPREIVPAGSVGIGGWQTGIYGLESPGGWQIIGRTDIAMFDATRKNPFYVSAGDRVKFVPTLREPSLHNPQNGNIQ